MSEKTITFSKEQVKAMGLAMYEHMIVEIDDHEGVKEIIEEVFSTLHIDADIVDSINILT